MALKMLRILTHRELSQKEIQRARESVGKPIEVQLRSQYEKQKALREIQRTRESRERFTLDKIKTKGYSISKEGYVVISERHVFLTTPDVSHGWKIPHSGYYKTRQEIRNYTLDGKLSFRRISINIPWHKDPTSISVGEGTVIRGGYISDKAVKYDPPGSFLGVRLSNEEIVEHARDILRT